MTLFDNPYLLISLSVAMHITWNLIARQVQPRANFLWWGIATHLCLLGPLGFASLIRHTQWNTSLVSALTVTALANTVYFLSLRKAYQLAPVALVYPLARSAPLLIALWSWCLFDEGLNIAELFAILISIVGLWSLASTNHSLDNIRVIAWAGLAALATSFYSISDKFAVPHLPSFKEQLGFISVGYFVAWLGLTIQQKLTSGFWIPPVRPSWTMILTGGLCIGSAYALVIRAMQYLPAAHTVAFTNSGIVIAVIISIFVFHERDHWQKRLFSASVISFGLILLAWAV